MATIARPHVGSSFSWSTSFDDLISAVRLPEPLGFGQIMAPLMVVSKYCDGQWERPSFERLESLQLAPHTQALHYGQAVFEGMKAYRNLGGGAARSATLLFRPYHHARRFNRSAERLGMPRFDEEAFVGALEALVGALESLVPNRRGQSLYLRPMMFGSTPSLSVVPSSDYYFVIVAAPSDAFFTAPISAWIERHYSRAGPGGTGSVKAAGNYAASFAAAEALRKNGFQQLLWLDAVERSYVEEFTAMNVFVRRGDRLITPPLSDTILAGITRDSLIALTRHLGIECVEERIGVDDLVAAIQAGEDIEMFGCGTGAVVSTVEMIGDETGLRLPLGDFVLAPQLRERLLDIQHGIETDCRDWQWSVPATAMADL
jgi:branched-chain amino acid aminotransferase